MARDPFFAGVIVVLWLLLGLFVLYPLACLFGRAFVNDDLAHAPVIQVLHAVALGDEVAAHDRRKASVGTLRRQAGMPCRAH